MHFFKLSLSQVEGATVFTLEQNPIYLVHI